MSSRFNPYTVIRRDPILPSAKRISNPMRGEKIMGSKIGLRVTSRMVEKGWEKSPKRVFIQM
jgi:hypothetical protein